MADFLLIGRYDRSRTGDSTRPLVKLPRAGYNAAQSITIADQ
jgi:hypothetical protein